MVHSQNRIRLVVKIVLLKMRAIRLRHVVEVVLVVLVLWGIRAWQHRDVANGPAPSLVGTTLDGAAYSLAANSDQPVLVHFWATWCSICRLEQSSIDNLAQDVRVITVAMQSGNAAEVERHLLEQELRFPVINDPDGAIATAWGVHAVPASFIIDPAGQVRFVEVGYTTQMGLQLRLWLAGLRADH